jgi:hypothetical protein
MARGKVTRKQQVLEELLRAEGGWVNGTDLANEAVGGSEGLKRLRELRAEGHEIDERRHPDPERTIWQYRLVRRTRVPMKEASRWVCPICHSVLRSTTVGIVPRYGLGYCPTCRVMRNAKIEGASA